MELDRMKNIKSIIPLALAVCGAGVLCGSIYAVVQRNAQIEQLDLKWRLESAYSFGYWYGVRTMLKHYPRRTLELSLIANEERTYEEVQQELDKTHEELEKRK